MIKSHKGYSAWLGARKRRKFGRYMYVYKDDSGNICFDAAFEWSKKYRDDVGFKPYAILDKNDNARLLWSDFKTNATTERNAWIQILGFGRTESKRGSALTNPVRFTHHGNGFWTRQPNSYTRQKPTIDVPMAPGLVVDLNSRSVVTAPPDLRKKIDRTKSKDIYPYARKCGEIFDVLHRLGVLEQVWEENKTTAYHPNAHAIPPELATLEEQQMAVLVEKAFLTKGGYSYVSKYEWTQYGRTERIGWQEKRARKTKDKVLKELRKSLQVLRGCVDVVDGGSNNKNQLGGGT